jgi:putative tryptophan/tyrosine transport system substrate-binding protein
MFDVGRRQLITLLGGAAAWPVTARAQRTDIPKIGVLWHAANEQEEAPYLNALRKGLRDLGYVEGHSIVLENRFANEQYELFNAQAAELATLKVQVLVAVTRSSAIAAQRATSTIPIVFLLPIRLRINLSLALTGQAEILPDCPKWRST